MKMIIVYDVLTRVEIYRGTSMTEALRAQYDYLNFIGIHDEREATRIEVIL
uniref:Uncharacterized protein n=1 Tax=Podoviridae sp. ctoyw14 TaxID=2826578 RepID=A0A8S5LVW5_9CAUD|nr:MAG TPA: hypothetical protein [Podoviridae sp. ctoyw14]